MDDFGKEYIKMKLSMEEGDDSSHHSNGNGCFSKGIIALLVIFVIFCTLINVEAALIIALIIILVVCIVLFILKLKIK